MFPEQTLTPLCEQCRMLNLRAGHFHLKSVAAAKQNSQSNARDPIALGSRAWSAIKGQKKCPLCCLIAHAVETTSRGWQDDDVPGTCEMTLTPMNLNENPGLSIDWDLLTLDVSAQYRWTRSDTISLLPTQSSFVSEPFVGRKTGSEMINVKQILDWLRLCQIEHRDDCEPVETPAFAQLRSQLLVIDVQEDRLTVLPPNGRYLALSYVWGGVDQQTTKLENILHFSARGGLRETISSLPRTIADACTLTKLLNERYLWVDMLSIIQDDAASKRLMIDQMHVIYRFAYLTIFAAMGADANAGLPGVSTPRRAVQQVASISEGLDLIHPTPFLSVQSSIWASRGWTYQEYFFSKRRLVFLDELVVYQCNTVRWREDVQQEHVREGLIYYQLNIGGDRMDWGPPRFDYMHNRFAHKRYEEYLTTYLDRNLSNDNDILNAFAGVITEAASCGLETHYGLAKQHFALDLLWLPRRWATRRNGFPSWSWAGWKCPIITFKLWPDYGSARIWTQRMSWIRFYALGEQQKGFQLIASGYSPDREESVQREEKEDDRERRFQHDTDQGNKTKVEILDPWDGRINNAGQVLAPLFSRLALNGIENWSEETVHSFPESCLASLQSGHLLFRTMTASLEMSGLKPDGQLPQAPRSDEPLLPSAPCLYLYTRRGDHIGTAWTHEKAVYDKVVSQRTDYQPSVKVEVAIIAGPVRADWRTRGESQSEKQITQELVSAGGNTRDILGRHETRANYHGLIGGILLEMLKERYPATYDSTPVERLGLDEAFWEEVEVLVRRTGNPCHTHGGFEVYKGLIMDSNTRLEVDITTRYFRILLLGDVDGEMRSGTDQTTEVIGKGEIREDSLGLIAGLDFRNILLK